MNVLRTWPLEPPPIEHGWRLPISQGDGRTGSDKQHYMPILSETNELLPALCGKLFNPGFATIPSINMRHCAKCERRLK